MEYRKIARKGAWKVCEGWARARFDSADRASYEYRSGYRSEGRILTRFGERDDLRGSRVKVVYLFFRFSILAFSPLVAPVRRSDSPVILGRIVVRSLIEIPRIRILVAAVKKLGRVNVLATIVSRVVGQRIAGELRLGPVQRLESQMPRHGGQSSIHVGPRSQPEFSQDLMLDSLQS